MLISENYNTPIGISTGSRQDSKLKLRSVQIAGADADDVGGVMLQSLLIIICLPPCLYLNLPLGVVHRKFQQELN